MRRLSATLIAVTIIYFMQYSDLYAYTINTTQTEPMPHTTGNLALTGPLPKGPNQAMHDHNSVNWAGLQSAVAISVTRKGAQGKPGIANFLSSAVMISPTVGLTAAHGLKDIIDAVVYYDGTINDNSPEIRIKVKKIHPEYKGNNFAGIDLAVFELEQPLHAEKYFIPIALNNQSLQNAVLQRIGFGERDTGAGVENRRTWILENYNRRITGDNYLTSEDKYGYAGDSGGPVFRTVPRAGGINKPGAKPDLVLELVGIHVGRMLDKNGKPLNESNTLILSLDIVDWINKTAASFAVTAPTTPAATGASGR